MCSMRRYLHARQGSAALLDVYCLYSSCRHTEASRQMSQVLRLAIYLSKF